MATGTTPIPGAGLFERIASSHPPFLLVCLWSVVVIVALSQATTDPEPAIVQVVEIGVPVALAFGLVPTVRSVARSDRPGELQSRILVFSLSLALIAAGTVVLIAITQYVEGRPVSDIPFMVIVAAAAGVAVGGPIGSYYDEAIAKREELTRQASRVRTLNQRLKVLLRLLRHNVRNELNVATGYLGLIGDRIEDESVRTLLERCEQALDNLHEHTEKSIHIESLDTTVGTVDVADEVRSLLEGIRTNHPEVTITADIPDSAPVRAHPMIDVAITETVQNAIEHNDPEDLVVDVDVTRTAGRTVVEVADTGTGLPDFERDVLGMDIETALQHGSGVGLWLVKWLVEESGGSVRFEDAEPDGLVVRFEFPSADGP